MASTSSAAPTSAQCAPCLAVVRAVLLLHLNLTFMRLPFNVLSTAKASCPLSDFKAVGSLNGESCACVLLTRYSPSWLDHSECGRLLRYYCTESWWWVY